MRGYEKLQLGRYHTTMSKVGLEVMKCNQLIGVVRKSATGRCESFHATKYNQLEPCGV